MSHHVVCSSNLETENGLQVLPLEPDLRVSRGRVPDLVLTSLPNLADRLAA
jgi:hypothetical protein